MPYGPNPNFIYPNENIKSVCFINNVISHPNIIVDNFKKVLIFVLVGIAHILDTQVLKSQNGGALRTAVISSI